MKRGRKPKDKIIKERDCEDWCFICKDGGNLILCDHSDCLKVYHPSCVEKDDSFAEAGENWKCGRHSCLICARHPTFYCYLCPTAVCGRCIADTDFAPVKGKQGLCCDCLDLVLLVEEKTDLENGVGNIDLKDRNTYECLFLEYWDIIKEKEGLTMNDIYSADSRMRKGHFSNCNSTPSRIVKEMDESDSVSSDGSLSYNEEQERKIWGRSQGLEFIGWGSKPVIEFLRYLGKDTSKEFSQFDVDAIISEYIQAKRLSDPGKKKHVICDEKLYLIFGKKRIRKNNIYNLLEHHFTKNLEQYAEDEDEDEEVEQCFLNDSDKSVTRLPSRRPGFVKSPRLEQESFQETHFASIVCENIRLIFLRRTLIEELSCDPDNFERKVVGCFVKVKNDHTGYTQGNSHHLTRITGTCASPSSNCTSEVLLSLMNISMPVHISSLSDFDVSQEEIDDLKSSIEQGLMPKLAIAEIEEKAKVVHADITKHWIQKELIRLQKLIDLANEKGWRRELGDYLLQRELLKKPAEQERLISRAPKVIAEFIKC